MSENDKVNILMVDDQPAKLLSYEAILDELGENLIKATSGREALEQLLKNDIAVVLMDVSMPEIDGFQLAEMIRQHPRCQKTAIIFISAVHMTDLDRLKGYQRGAVDYISVPVVPELLRAKVSVFAELHRKARQLETLNRELEQRVAERTEELKQRAEALQLLNGELARKNQELDAIVKTAPDIIFSRQADGARDYISGRFYEFTGAPAGSANGFGWLDYVHPEDRERSVAQWMRCVETGENYESEYRLARQRRAISLVSRSGRAASRSGRAGAPMVWHLLRHSRQQGPRASHARERERTGTDGGREDRGFAPSFQPLDDDAGRRTPPHRARVARRIGAGTGCDEDAGEWHRRRNRPGWRTGSVK